MGRKQGKRLPGLEGNAAMDLYTENLVKPVQGAKYDGTNSAALAEKIPDFTVGVETPTELNFTSGGTSYTVARGGHVVWQNGVVTEVFQNDDDKRDAWTAVAVGDHKHDLTLATGGAIPLS
jgi:hypothetical protein